MASDKTHYHHLNFQRFSPLTRRILMVNLGALLVLFFGFLYTGQYERELIENELKALHQEGQLIAAALSEGGVREGFVHEQAVLAEDLSQLMVRKLGENSNLRTRLYNKSGRLVADSHQLLGAGGRVQMVELPPPEESLPLRQRIDLYTQKPLSWLPTRLKLPLLPQYDFDHAGEYHDLISAFSGLSGNKAWRDADGHILLSATLPVQRVKSVLGAILITRHGHTIDESVTAVQWAVIKIFIVSALITILLSLYLSETIGRPIKRLAIAAERVRRRLGKHDIIPDFNYRKDEIGQLSMSLREMTQSLSERMDAIERFAADVAHELKNPIASVRSAMETLEKIKDPEKREKLKKIIEHDLVRMDRLISDISSASRLDAELNRIDRTTHDLIPVLKSLADIHDLRPNKGSDKIDVEVIVHNNLETLNVPIHEGRFSQVIENLLTNAASFAPVDSVIKITLGKEADQAVISVENQGRLIPENKLEAIFERFYSERPKSEKFGTHSGLGLSISRQIMQAHQGHIYAENIYDAEGQAYGVRFVLNLPLAKK